MKSGTYKPDVLGFSTGSVPWLSTISKLVGHPLVSVAVLFTLLPLITVTVGLDVGTEICILALYAVAFNLLLGYTGIASFGHSIFFGLGSYGVGLIQIYLIPSTSAALLMVMILCFVVAIFLGAIVIRRRGIYFSLLMLACTQMMFTIAFRWKVTGGEMGLQGILRYAISPFNISITSPQAFYVFAAVVSLLGIGILWVLLQTPYGKVLQGIRENEKRMRLLGCNTTFYKLSALAISGAFAGLAGGLNGLLFRSTYAQIFDWMSAGTVLVIAVLGGTRYFLGPVVGALIYVFLRYFLASHTEHWMIVLGLIFILSILFLPDGIVSFYPRMMRQLGKGQLLWGNAPYQRPAAAEIAVPEKVRPKGLTISGLSKRFGALVVADDISLEVKPGQLFAVIGPNGAGKTTLFNMISGVLSLDAGKISIGDVEIQSKTEYQRVRMGLARSFQIVSVFKSLTAFENIRLAVQTHLDRGHIAWELAGNLHDVTARTWAVLDSMGLSDKAHIPTEQLSHGDQRLVEICISIALDPPILLLDEPLAGLAEAERESVAAMIRSLAPKHTVVLIEHDIDRVLAIADHIAVLHQGHVIASGDPATVAADAEVQRVYLGTRQQGETAGLCRAGQAAASAGPLLLSVRDLVSGYGKSHVLHGVSLDIRQGEFIGLLGRNGVGKTTTVMSIGGVLRPVEGHVVFRDREITQNTPELTRLAGIGIVPQGRRIFPNLTVMENLRVSQIPNKPGRWKEQEVFELFPLLKDRRDQKGRYLSGGEQQLLAVARSLMAPLDLLILDEPLEGLSPVMATLVADAIERLRKENLTVLLVEQTANIALRLVDRVYVLNNGQVIYEGKSSELLADTEKQERLLGIHV